MKKITTLISLLILMLVSVFVYRWWHATLPLISPLDLLGTLPPLQKVGYHPKKIVYGFLPYWNIKYSDQIPIRYLTHLAYFGIDLNPDGTIKTHENRRELEPGWNKLSTNEFSLLRRQLKLLGKKTILTIRAMDNDQIEKLVNSPQNRQLAIASVLEVAQDQQFDGLNIDFEYTGSPDPATKQNFTLFTQVLAQTCRNTILDCEVSIDIYADSANKNRLWDLPTIAAAVDHVLVMTYDFYRPSSSQAGPVAPLRGKCQLTPTNWENQTDCLEYDVTSSVADLIKVIPTQKLLLGIPFYGYQWQTSSPDFLANAYPNTGQLATYKRIQALFSDPTVSSLSASWSATAMSPYITFIKDDKMFQIHYEDARSLGYKLDLVNQSSLAGIGIWALGYETPLDDLWITIAQKL